MSSQEPGWESWSNYECLGDMKKYDAMPTTGPSKKIDVLFKAEKSAVQHMHAWEYGRRYHLYPFTVVIQTEDIVAGYLPGLNHRFEVSQMVHVFVHVCRQNLPNICYEAR